jgi:hypothetical protein
MDARDLPVETADDAARLVRALGQHRYIDGRLHLVHAFVFLALDSAPELEAALEWARGVAADPSIERASKDERLWRRSSEIELAHALRAFWGPGDARERAHARLRELLAAAEIALSDAAPFDDEGEDGIFPILIDAGWELVPMARFDPQRHKGAIEAFGEPILFEAAKFEEESRFEPEAYLQELPALGPRELLDGASAEGTLAAPLTLWTSGPDAYHDYVLRGVLRAAKIGTPATG